MSAKNITPLSKEIGRKITVRRKQLSYTQKELSIESGLAPSAINMIEQGLRTPSIDSLRKLCVVLGIRSDDLIFSTDENKIINAIKTKMGEILYANSERIKMVSKINNLEEEE